MSSINRQLDKFWYTLSYEEKETVNQTGIDWEHPRTTTNQKIAALKVLSERNKEAEKRTHDSKLKHDLTDKILDRIEGIARESSERKTEAYLFVEAERNRLIRSMEIEKLKAFSNIERDKLTILERMIGEMVTKSKEIQYEPSSGEIKELTEGEQNRNLHIEVPTMGNCIVGGDGLQSVVLTRIRQDGETIQQCTVAHAAHTRNMIPLQIFSQDKLKQAGCPLHDSRDIRHQIVGVRWFYIKERCYLADGHEHRIGEIKTSLME